VDEACAVYDSAGDAAWLFGGLHYDNTYPSGWTTQVMGDLWRLDVASASWAVVPSLGPRPPARQGASLVLDPVRGRMWLFGGVDSLGAPLNDLWSMDLAAPGAWSLVTPGPGPAPRARHLAVFDPSGDRMLVTGGMSGATPRSDTWALSLSGSPGWQSLATTGTPPAGRLVGAFDAARGRVLAGGDGDGVIYTLDRASAEWSAHRPVGDGTIWSGSTVILDPTRDALISAWSGYVTSQVSPYTPPTAFLHLSPSQPVHLTATFDHARFLYGVTYLDWDLQFDRPLWLPAVVESTSLSGVTGAIDSASPTVPGLVEFSARGAWLAADTVQLHVRWFNGSAWQTSPDVGFRFAPAPQVLHITPDSLRQSGQAGNHLDVWFHVPDDSATFLVDQTLERRENAGAWTAVQRGYPDITGTWWFADDPVVRFSTYEYRLTWPGPDGSTHASPSVGTTVLGPPTPLDSDPGPGRVTLRWSTAPGIDEIGRVFAHRNSGVAGPPWDDTLAVRTDASGIMTVVDTEVGPGENIIYALEWFDGRQWQWTPPFGVWTTNDPPPPVAFSLGRARPNPASDGFDLPVEVTGPGPARIELFDLGGRLRWSGSVAPGATALHLDTAGLPAGIYLVRGEMSGLVRTGRVVVIR